MQQNPTTWDAWQAAMERILEALKQKFPAGGTSLSAEAIFTRDVR